VTFLGLHVERRDSPTAASQAVALGLALLAALVATSILIIAAGASVPDAVSAFFRGAFGSRTAIGETLVQATPLIFTGLAVVVAFRARVWNIGGDGQFMASAIVWGGVWGLIPGLLKVRFGANEVVVTVMMNFVIQYLLSYLLSGPWRDPASFYLQTAMLPEDSFLARFLEPSRLHIGFVLAVATAVIVAVVLRRTTLGYDIRAVGGGANAARYRGISVAAVTVTVMAISGAIAGLGGGVEITGLQHRLRLDISTGYGFAGVMVALLAKLSPLGVVVAAIAFGALVNGSTAIQLATGVPTALVSAIQGLTLVFALMSEALTRYQISRPIRV
jgi:ABC-type uncharacterized transport system permease subunit